MTIYGSSRPPDGRRPGAVPFVSVVDSRGVQNGAGNTQINVFEPLLGRVAALFGDDPRPVNRNAVVALIFAVLAVFFLPVPLGIGAIVYSGRARRELDVTRERGAGTAFFAHTVGWITLGIMLTVGVCALIISLLVEVVIPRFAG